MKMHEWLAILPNKASPRARTLLILGIIGVIIIVAILNLPPIPRLLSPIVVLLFFLAIFFGMITVSFVIIEVVRMIKKQSPISNLPQNILAFLCGILILGIFILPNFHAAATPKKIRQAKKDMARIATALEAYYVDNGCYPSPGRVSFRESGSYYGEGSYDKEGGIIPIVLTTPVAYMTALPHDPFRRNGRGYYGYGGGPGLTGAGGIPTFDDNDHDYSGIWPKKGWIITSYGPDVVDGTFDSTIGYPNNQPLREELAWSDSYSIDSPDFMQCDTTHPLQTSGFTYDPTNGTTSGGDIWRRGP